MSFKQAMLMTVVVFFSAIWFMFWITSSNYYPPLNELITFEGKISHFSPRRGKSNGSITIITKTKDINLWTRLGEDTTDNYGDLIGRQVIAMIQPNFEHSSGYTPEILHLEIIDGDVIIDYQSRREDHLRLLKNYDRITMAIKIIISIFSFMLIYSFFKSKRS